MDRAGIPAPGRRSEKHKKDLRAINAQVFFVCLVCGVILHPKIECKLQQESSR
jgi:hypothetical protein